MEGSRAGPGPHSNSSQYNRREQEQREYQHRQQQQYYSQAQNIQSSSTQARRPGESFFSSSSASSPLPAPYSVNTNPFNPEQLLVGESNPASRLNDHGQEVHPDLLRKTVPWPVHLNPIVSPDYAGSNRIVDQPLGTMEPFVELANPDGKLFRPQVPVRRAGESQATGITPQLARRESRAQELQVGRNSRREEEGPEIEWGAVARYSGIGTATPREMIPLPPPPPPRPASTAGDFQVSTQRDRSREGLGYGRELGPAAAAESSGPRLQRGRSPVNTGNDLCVIKGDRCERHGVNAKFCKRTSLTMMRELNLTGLMPAITLIAPPAGHPSAGAGVMVSPLAARDPHWTVTLQADCDAREGRTPQSGSSHDRGSSLSLREYSSSSRLAGAAHTPRTPHTPHTPHPLHAPHDPPPASPQAPTPRPPIRRNTAPPESGVSWLAAKLLQQAHPREPREGPPSYYSSHAPARTASQQAEQAAFSAQQQHQQQHQRQTAPEHAQQSGWDFRDPYASDYTSSPAESPAVDTDASPTYSGYRYPNQPRQHYTESPNTTYSAAGPSASSTGPHVALQSGHGRPGNTEHGEVQRKRSYTVFGERFQPSQLGRGSPETQNVGGRGGSYFSSASTASPRPSFERLRPIEGQIQYREYREYPGTPATRESTPWPDTPSTPGGYLPTTTYSTHPSAMAERQPVEPLPADYNRSGPTMDVALQYHTASQVTQMAAPAPPTASRGIQKMASADLKSLTEDSEPERPKARKRPGRRPASAPRGGATGRASTPRQQQPAHDTEGSIQVTDIRTSASSRPKQYYLNSNYIDDSKEKDTSAHPPQAQSARPEQLYVNTHILPSQPPNSDIDSPSQMQATNPSPSTILGPSGQEGTTSVQPTQQKSLAVQKAAKSRVRSRAKSHKIELVMKNATPETMAQSSAEKANAKSDDTPRYTMADGVDHTSAPDYPVHGYASTLDYLPSPEKPLPSNAPIHIQQHTQGLPPDSLLVQPLTKTPTPTLISQPPVQDQLPQYTQTPRYISTAPNPSDPPPFTQTAQQYPAPQNTPIPSQQWLENTQQLAYAQNVQNYRSASNTSNPPQQRTYAQTQSESAPPTNIYGNNPNLTTQLSNIHIQYSNDSLRFIPSQPPVQAQYAEPQQQHPVPPNREMNPHPQSPTKEAALPRFFKTCAYALERYLRWPHLMPANGPGHSVKVKGDREQILHYATELRRIESRFRRRTLSEWYAVHGEDDGYLNLHHLTVLIHNTISSGEESANSSALKVLEETITRLLDTHEFPNWLSKTETEMEDLMRAEMARGPEFRERQLRHDSRHLAKGYRLRYEAQGYFQGPGLA